MRIAAVADLHYSPQNYDRIRAQMSRVRDDADVLVIAGDLTNFGRIPEMESLLSMLVRLRIPIVAILGNHDFESGHQEELMKMMSAEGIIVLDGSGYERDGVGFAGTKGFLGGFGRGMLTAFGEPEVKRFVQVSIDEALKLELAMSQLRTERRVVVVHYSPIAETAKGEPMEIYPYLGNSQTGRGSGPSRCRLSVARPCAPRLARWKDHGGNSSTQCCAVDPAVDRSYYPVPALRRVTALVRQRLLLGCKLGSSEACTASAEAR